MSCFVWFKCSDTHHAVNGPNKQDDITETVNIYHTQNREQEHQRGRNHEEHTNEDETEERRTRKRKRGSVRVSYKQGKQQKRRYRTGKNKNTELNISKNNTTKENKGKQRQHIPSRFVRLDVATESRTPPLGGRSSMMQHSLNRLLSPLVVGASRPGSRRGSLVSTLNELFDHHENHLANSLGGFCCCSHSSHAVGESHEKCNGQDTANNTMNTHMTDRSLMEHPSVQSPSHGLSPRHHHDTEMLLNRSRIPSPTGNMTITEEGHEGDERAV